NTGNSTSPTTGSITTTHASTYCAAVMAMSSADIINAQPAGYNVRQTTNTAGADVDKIRSSTGSENPGWTLNLGINWTAVISAYYATDSAPPNNNGERIPKMPKVYSNMWDLEYYIMRRMCVPPGAGQITPPATPPTPRWFIKT